MFALIALIPQINLDLPAVRMADLLPQVGAQAGLKLKCSPEARQIALCIRVHDADPETFLKQLALATGGHWVKVKEERIFQLPDPDSIRPFTVAKIATAKARIRNRKEPTDDLDEKTAEDAFLGLPNDPIANMKVGDRIVFSNTPTALQRELPAALTPILAEDLFKSSAAEFARAPAPDGIPGPGKALVNPKLTVVVSISRSTPDELNIAIQQEPRNQESETYTSSTRTFRLRLDEDPPEGANVSEANPFKVPPTSIAWADAVQGRKRALTTDQREALLHPETNDPLGFFVQEALRQWTLTHPEQIVLAISDDAFAMVSSYLAYRSINAAQLDHFLRFACRKISQEPGWLTMAAAIPAGGTYAVGEALRKASKSGQMTEDDLNMDLMQETGDLTSGTFFLMSEALGIQPMASLESSFGAGDDARLARRFYAALTPTQRQRAAQDSLAFGTLSGVAKTRFAEMVYGADANLFGSSGDPQTRAEWVDPFEISVPVSAEPTVELVNGIPADAPIQVVSFKQKAIEIMPPDRDDRREFTDPANLGNLIALAQAGDAAAARRWHTSRFSIGTRESRWIICGLSNQLMVCSRLAVRPFQRQGKTGTYEELPADVRKLIEKPRPESYDEENPPTPP